MGMPAALQGGGIVPMIIAIIGAIICVVGAICIWATDQKLWGEYFSWAVIAVIGFCVMNFLCFFLRSSSPGAIVLGLLPCAAFVFAFPHFISVAQSANNMAKLYDNVGDDKHRDQARTLCAGAILAILGAMFTFAVVPSWGSPSSFAGSFKKAVGSIDFILTLIGFVIILIGSIIGWAHDSVQLSALWVAVSALILQITGDPNYLFTDTLAGAEAYNYWVGGHSWTGPGASGARKQQAEYFICFIGLMFLVVAAILRGVIPNKMSIGRGGGGGDGGKVAPATETA